MPALRRSSLGLSLPRRSFLLGSAGAGVALVAACSSDKKDPAPISGGSTSSAGAFPVTVAGQAGPVTVPAAPRRVVAAGYLRDTDLALALGANLVGAARSTSWPSGLAPWQKPTTKPTLFATGDGLPTEQLAALHPDLILASDDYTLAKDYATLSKIAPTLSYRQGVGTDSWEDMTTRAGQVLGKTAEATKLVADTRAKIASLRAQHPELTGKTFTFGPVSGLDSIFTISRSDDASAVFFSQLGMKLAPAVTSLPPSATAGRSLVSAERIEVLDADVLIIAYTKPGARAELEGNQLFKRLEAVQRGSYVALDLTTAIAVAFPSVLSIPFGLDATVPLLSTAVSKS